MGRVLMPKKLAECQSGETVIITKLLSRPSIRQRLSDLGFVRGSVLNIIRYAPLKDPMEVIIKGSHISLRIEEADTIEVEKVEDK